MANVFVYTPTDSIVPTMAERKATDLISKVAEMFERPLPATVENVEETAEQRKADLFTKVATGEVTAEEAATFMKSIMQETAEARRLAKQEPKIMLMNGEPATLKEIKRAFRNADSGTYVKVESLEGKNSGTITMFRP